MSDFLKSIVKEVGNEYASIVEDGVEAGDVSTFIDTGSFILNGLLSWKYWESQFSNFILSWKYWESQFSNFLSSWKYMAN